MKVENKNKFVCLIKRDYQDEQWDNVNPILALGELVVAYSDGGKKIYKIGNGYSPWRELPEITKLEELGKGFVLKTVDGKEVKVVLDPWKIKYAQIVPIEKATDDELIRALREIYEKLNQDGAEVVKLQEEQKHLINELASRGSLLRAYYELGG